MRFIGFFRKNFMTYYWTTINNTIYYPTTVNDPESLWNQPTVEHELVHVVQQKKYSLPLFLLLYCFFPIPIFGAYFRWKFEREAYLEDIKANMDPVCHKMDWEILSSGAADTLWDGYFWCWPRNLMYKWFMKQYENFKQR